MNKDSREFFEFFYKTYITSKIFNPDSDKYIKIEKKIIENEFFSVALLSKLEDMNKGKMYPVEIRNRMICLTKQLGNYIEPDIFNKMLIECEKLRETKNGKEIYLEEYSKRFMEPEEILKSKLHINKLEINNSLLFDFATLFTIMNQDIEIYENDYYLYSIKAFLHDYPKMFEDRRVNEKTLEILKLQKDSELRDRLIYKMENITKFTKKGMNYINIREAYKYILIQNMLIDNDVYDSYKHDIPFLMDMLRDVINDNLIDNDNEKNNAIKMLNDYRNTLSSLPDEEKNIMYEDINSYITKVNVIEYLNYKRISELHLKFGFRNIRDSIKYFDKVDELIYNDLFVINYLLSGKDNGISYEDAVFSIRKLLNLCPTLFDDPKVYDRVSLLLSDKKSKRELKKIKNIYKG